MKIDRTDSHEAWIEKMLAAPSAPKREMSLDKLMAYTKRMEKEEMRREAFKLSPGKVDLIQFVLVFGFIGLCLALALIYPVFFIGLACLVFIMG
jgi:fatty acid desaturase